MKRPALAILVCFAWFSGAVAQEPAAQDKQEPPKAEIKEGPKADGEKQPDYQTALYYTFRNYLKTRIASG